MATLEGPGRLRLDDGRRLAFEEWGDPRGDAVVLLHGTPGSRRQLRFEPDVASLHGVRLVAIDRPGYGDSSYDPRRSLASGARDVAALADALAIDKLSVLGFSGGGPNAAACAACLGELVTATALVSSPAPPGAWRPERRGAMRLAASARRWADAGLQLKRSRVAHRGGPGSDGAEVLTLATVRTMVQDRRLGRRDWRLDLRSIRGSVDVWHGTNDLSVSVTAAHSLMEVLGTASLHLMPGEGHGMVFDRYWEIVEALTRPAPHRG